MLAYIAADEGLAWRQDTAAKESGKTRTKAASVLSFAAEQLWTDFVGVGVNLLLRG